MKIIFLMSLSALFIYTGNAFADPKNGFGISVGATKNMMNSTYTVGSVANPIGSTSTYDSSGVSLGIDYQITYPNHLTLNPFLIVSSETTSLSSQSGDTMGHNILGFQGRYWKGDFFVGVHAALYTETYSISGVSTTSETGSGQGLVIGWEPTNRRWSLMLQGDYAPIKYANQDVNWAGARLSVGYRWK